MLGFDRSANTANRVGRKGSVQEKPANTSRISLNGLVANDLTVTRRVLGNAGRELRNPRQVAGHGERLDLVDLRRTDIGGETDKRALDQRLNRNEEKSSISTMFGWK